jgi:hypothetical protein
MTNSDLREAREHLDSPPRGRRTRDRILVLGASVAVILAVGAWQLLRDDDASPAPVKPEPTPSASALSTIDEAFLQGEPPTPALLEGVWRLDNPDASRMLFAFTGDMGFRYDDTGRLSEDPLVDGGYELDGDLITVHVDGGLAQCQGQEFALRAVVNDNGGLNVLPVGDGAVSCSAPLRQQWVLEQVLPMPDGPGEVTLPPADDWPAPGHDTFVGSWLAQDAGYILELRMEGSYSVLAGHGEVVDRGTWVDDHSSTRLTLTSTSDSPTCEAGARFVLGGLRAKDIGAVNLRGTPERDDCAGGWAREAWFKLS